MGLGFNTEPSTGGSKFLPVVKFDAKAGDLLAVNREPAGDGTWDKSEVEIQTPVKVVMDLNGIEIGWIMFTPSYNAVMVPVGKEMPPKPSDQHKQAVRIKLFFKEHGWREFTPTSKTVQRAVDKLHDEYLEARAAHPGKMPVVTIEGSEVVKVKTPEGELRFKAPKWSITGWTDAPAMPDNTPPPAAAAKPKPKADDMDEF